MKKATTHLFEFRIHFIFKLFFLILITAFSHFPAQAQFPSFIDYPEGEEEQFYVHRSHTNPYAPTYVISNKGIYVQVPTDTDLNDINTSILYRVPDSPDVYIVRGYQKISVDITGARYIYVILQLSNNSMQLLNVTTGSTQTISPASTSLYAAVIDLAGDALYQIVSVGSSYYTYISQDTGQTWQADTLGYNTSEQLYSVVTDTFQNAFLAGDSGVYMQTPHGTTWALTSFPLQPATLVYVDELNRIWAAGTDGFGYNWIYKSTDDGLHWGLDSAGIGPLYTSIRSMGSDPLGNVYMICRKFGLLSGGNLLYKSAGGTAPWVRIDAGILAYNAMSGDSGIINSVTGDSAAIFVATNIGGFVSYDGGVTWSPLNGLNSDYCYGIVGTSNGKLLATNDLGCFMNTGVDSVWNKVYPDSGFAGEQSIWKDDAGNLYTGKSLVNPLSVQTGSYFNVKSTDNGQTWTPDTAGLSHVTISKWWVDESGNEYAAYGSKNWTKTAAGSWTIDTTGVAYNPSYDLGEAFGSDHNGKVYYSVYSGNIFSRSISGGTWSTETGLGADPVYSLAHTSTHTMIGGGTNYIHYKSGASWQDMPINAPAPQSTSPFIVAVDDSDYVWAAFSHMGGSGLYQGDGVFYTHDMGAHWYAPSGQVSFITFKMLVPVGDSVFGVSYANGIYVFKRGGGVNGINKVSDLQSLNLYPNPASTECRAVFTLPAGSQDAELVLYDDAGRAAKKVPVRASATSVSFSTADMSRGTYFCALRSGGKMIGAEKLVVE